MPERKRNISLISCAVSEGCVLLFFKQNVWWTFKFFASSGLFASLGTSWWYVKEIVSVPQPSGANLLFLHTAPGSLNFRTRWISPEVSAIFLALFVLLANIHTSYWNKIMLFLGLPDIQLLTFFSCYLIWTFGKEDFIWYGVI